LHVSSGFKTLTDELVSSFKLIELLEANIPRPVNASFRDWIHVYVDASFEPGGYSGIRGVAYDKDGKCLALFSDQIHPSPLRLIKRENQESRNNHL
jgi:hypothetical protein